MYNNPIQAMIGKKVKVIADNIAYSGLLIELSDTSLELKCEVQWITIPIDIISSIEADE
ncbi:MAG: hypothetical protein IT392_03365 [Nitrospirae bacterium]|nr:hypothetical protein [Nitrospirota bacterium]